MAHALQTSAGDERLGWLDSLRGGAALAIGLFHATIFLFLGAADAAMEAGRLSATDLLSATILAPARYGYVGFSMFFLVSGFAIHLPIATGAVPFRFRTFIVRRFCRLYVPYVVALGIGLALVPLLRIEPPIDVAAVTKAVFFLANYPHSGGPYFELYLQNPQQNFVIWTVSIEFELYFLYPLLLRAFARLGPVATLGCVAAVSFVAAVLIIYADPPTGRPGNLVSLLPVFTPFWVVWATGAALAEAWARGKFPRWHLGWTVTLVALGLVILVSRPLGIARLYEVFVTSAFCGVLFVRLAVEPAGMGARIVLELLRRLGRISYSYYLIQIPTFYVVGAAWLASGRRLNAEVVAIALFVAVPVGFGFYRVVERPSTRFARAAAQRFG